MAVRDARDLGTVERVYRSRGHHPVETFDAGTLFVVRAERWEGAP